MFDCVVPPSHPVLGKPVRIRRRPATVSGDDGPLCHRYNGKAGLSANPKPGDRPGSIADCLPRGGWLVHLARCPLSICDERAPVWCCPLPPRWTSPSHEGGYAYRAIVACKFVFARLPTDCRNFLPVRLTSPGTGSRDDFPYSGTK